MENLKDTSYTSKKSEPYNQSSEQVAELAQSDFSEESAFCNQEEYGLWAGFCASVSPQLNAPDSNREMITPLSQEADEEYKQVIDEALKNYRQTTSRRCLSRRKTKAEAYKQFQLIADKAWEELQKAETRIKAGHD